MTSAALRDRLHSLWASLTDPGMDQRLLSDNVVPSKFLIDNNITLTSDVFSFSNTAADNLNKKPPVLFLLRPQNIITEHPIDFKDEFFTLAAEEGAPEDDPSPATQVKKILDHEWMFFYRGASLAHYIEDWAMDGYPRWLPTGCPNLATLCGIHGVATPHALNVETRGFQRSGRSLNIQWETRIYEYNKKRPNGSTLYPHLILLGVQSCNGNANTISLGELTSIVTAMRCRAYQSATFNEQAILVGDAKQSANGDPAPDREDRLAFKDEKRFPVIMVSLIGPQHVRVIYACMDGSKLFIRISGFHKIQPTDEMIMRNIAGVLLSRPLVEST
ncbi:hypothetical protein BDW59DRAFT_180241 [Aspergillus cavernicola]|uniref:Uncharacterized protein n=1 Tax=Aspergillus cavernicola TaxID=176166 RepID=A0ABR4I9E5_9EURO